MPPRLLIVCWSLSLAGLPAAAENATFYVSPSGNDSWTGRSATRAGGDGPFATPARARDAARVFRRANPQAGPVVVSLAGGRYELAEPLTFAPEDSGTAASPVRFVAADGATPVLSGGVRVTGWKPGPNGVWTAPLPKGAPASFRYVSVNGRMRSPSRLPKQGVYAIAGLAGADPKAKYNTPGDKFEFKPGEIRGDWKNLHDIEVVVLHFWVDAHFKIKAVDPEKRVVYLDRPSRRRLTETHGPQPARYYLSNVAEALTEPGEFYADRAADTIAYIPKPGEDLTTAEVVIPRLPAVVRFDGRPAEGKFVEHVELSGLTVADATWDLPPKDAGDTQAASLAPGAVQLRGARHCAAEGCRVAAVAGYAFDVGDGCRHNRIARCEAADVGAGGVRMTGGAAGSPEALRTGENVVTDNHLHRLGRLFPSGVGVLLMHADRNKIQHNHIHDLFYTGVSVGWVWGYKPSVSVGNAVEYNRIHDVGQKLLSDMGGVYTLGVSPGTVIRGNVVHDVDAFTYGGWGIYTDEGSTGITVEKNLVYRTKTGGFHQHYGRENVVRNNVFALAREDQVQRSRAEPHVSFTFERNVVYYRTGTLLGKNWKDDQFVLDRNVYWNAAGQPVTFPGGLTLGQWQARGFDKNSVVADPLFVDPEKGDFRLKGGSPAAKLGFEPWDYATAGVRPK